MKDRETIWVRYTWDLPNLSLNLQKPPNYLFRSAQPTELNAAITTVLAAYTSDAVWEHQIERIRERMAERITSTLGRAGSEYLAAEFRGNLVAISGVAKSHWTDQNLLTGVCVLPEHQRKGLGSYLLGLSLSWLRETGLLEARVYTEAGSVADRKIYPLFGSIREEGVEYPGAKPSNKSLDPTPRQHASQDASSDID